MPVFIKRAVWNWKHQSTGIDPRRCPQDLLEALRTLGADACVLDLGCGPGNLRAALRLRGWKGHFIGVDVSEKVIAVARKAHDSNAEWHAAPIEGFTVPDQKANAVCLCESIYYVKPKSVPLLIDRCRHSLGSPGRIVIRIWHADRHREYIDILLGLGAQPTPPIYILNHLSMYSASSANDR
jgi:SAM-dependent methyltransferase